MKRMASRIQKPTAAVTPLKNDGRDEAEGSALRGISIIQQSPAQIAVNPRNARTHSPRQIQQIAESIKAFGFVNPVLVDDDNMVLAGHGRLAAAQLLGMTRVPTLLASGLTKAQRRAFVLADNKIAQNAGWDMEVLALELGELAIELPTLDLDITITGFEAAEIDMIHADRDAGTPEDGDAVPDLQREAVSKLGDLWLLGGHRLLCGDSRSTSDMARLMGGDKARLVFTDPPYNVSIAGHVQGRGRTKHREFAFASGEMSREDFTAFLKSSLRAMANVCCDGAILYVCMDWRHLPELTAAAVAVGLEQKNLVVWDKRSPGQGSFYRSQHELIPVFKRGSAPHRNNFGLGGHGRTRSNVWSYAGVNSFRAGRQAELEMHPTVKPIALVVDAIRDCSNKGEVVLDGFLGSGTTLLAAERVGRRCRGMEYDPLYVDLCIRRWQDFTKQEAELAGDGRTWREVADCRASQCIDDPPGSALSPARLRRPPAVRKQLILHKDLTRRPAPRAILLNHGHGAPAAEESVHLPEKAKGVRS